MILRKEFVELLILFLSAAEGLILFPSEAEGLNLYPSEAAHRAYRNAEGLIC